MPARSSGRSYSLRRRAASSVVSIDAPSTAASAAVHATASYYSPLVHTSADRQGQAQEDAEEGREEAVVGGGLDGGVVGSTDSVVRVGLSVHSGHSAVGPVHRSVSDSATARTLPRYIRETVVSEAVCTLDSCTHCCACHILHPCNGYGRCMKTATVPYADCRCAGRCTAGRCAQTECTSNRVVVGLTTSDLLSQSTVVTATRPYHSAGTRRPSDASTVSTPSTLPLPLPGVRRDSDGAQLGEEVCVSPQAGMHASPTAAYRLTSTTVADSGLAASRVVGVAEVAGTTVSTYDTGDDRAEKAGRSKGPQLPSPVLLQLRALPHTPRIVPVIADGRCSVESTLLARGAIPDAHRTKRHKRVIDAGRRRLGQFWTEREWIQRVPVHLRGGNRRPDATDATLRRSYHVYQRLLTADPPTAWLDHCVFYLASAAHDIGALVIHTEGDGPWYCRQIGADKSSHIVVYHACGHYEAVEYNGLRQFSSDHEFVVQLARFAAAQSPPYPAEDDDDLLEVRAEDEGCRMAATTSQQPPPPAVDGAPAVPARPQRAKQATRKQCSAAKAKRALEYGEQQSAAQPLVVPQTSSGVVSLPSLIASVAQHGPLYERVSFHNQPQWRAANEPLWNAYRLASLSGHRSQQTAILLDILQLPQRVLPKLGRSGRAARRRVVADTARRLRTEAERLRAWYNCPDPSSSDNQQAQMSTDTMLNTAAQGGYERPQRAASVAARQAIRQQAAETTNSDPGAETSEDEAVETAVDSEDELNEPFASLSQNNRQHSMINPDSRATRRADYLVRCGLTRKAAQVLHSTTQMADLRTAAAQQAMLQLHPRSPADTVVPGLPEQAPPAVLEDDAGMRRLLTQSDNGASAGPSGWGGNMLPILVQSDMCRLGVIALLRDIVNGELPDDARQLLLTSRLVALAKPNSDGCRPIAVGELFYRLAAIVAVRRVSSEAAVLLAPH